MLHICVIVGTRPEAVKMAAVIAALRGADQIRCTVVSTGQHREMLRRTLDDFGLAPDVDLDVMQPGQSLAALSSRLFVAIDGALADLAPDWLLVQGDTTSVMIAALCAFYRGVKVGHVEAGLRSHNMHAPFPEEINRRVVSLVATLHFAPTRQSSEHLKRENIPENQIIVTGNTGIDALLAIAKSTAAARPPLSDDIARFLEIYKKFVLITGHRRENFGQGFVDICDAIQTLADAYPSVGFLYPVHLNPAVRTSVFAMLSRRDNILLAPPQEYKPFIFLMSKSMFVLTDSGGVQEEAPSLAKPVLVMRDVTERPEGIAAGSAELVGTSSQRIVAKASELLTDPDAYARMAQIRSPYGDGEASHRILSALLAHSNRTKGSRRA